MTPVRAPRRLAGVTTRLRPEDGRAGADAGYSLVEVMIAMFTTLIIFGITIGIVVGIQEEEQTAGATITGARQAQLTTLSVLQYIRAAYGLTAVSGTAAGAANSSFTIDSYIGTSQGKLTPNDGQITIKYAAGTPTGTLTMRAAGLMGSPPSTTNQWDQFVTHDLIAPGSSTPVFTYYAYQEGAAPGTIEAISDPATCLGDIVAIGIDLTFSLPNGQTVVPHAIPGSGSTLDSIIYLHNVTASASAPAGGVC